jgi:transcriptional regulator with XRE-family HTH domain
MTINPDRLHKLRVQLKLSRDQLAEKSKISPRQISRLENESASSKGVRERTIVQLAEALNVEPGVLTDELPMPERRAAGRPGEGERVQVSALLSPEVRLAYALIKRRYNVNTTTIFNLAPLMFTLLAEGSFDWRSEKLKEVEEAANQLSGLSDIAGHLSFANVASMTIDSAASEEASIQQNDLFGKTNKPDDFLDFGYDQSTNNPFADYLRGLARKINKPDVVEVNKETLGYYALEDLPLYEICAGDIQQISGDSIDAAFALKYGFARLGDIPDELWAEDASEQRMQWLEEKLPEDIRDAFSEPVDPENSQQPSIDDNLEVDR